LAWSASNREGVWYGLSAWFLYICFLFDLYSF
jgi:hypothetical protein